jgi:hypothetical protein
MNPEKLPIEAIKSRLLIPEVWRRLELPGEPGKCCASPFRPDKKPSFSVFMDGQRFRDHASGEGGSVLDFIQLALKLPLDGALQWAREQCGGGAVVLPRATASCPLRLGKQAASGTAKVKPSPPLRRGSVAELQALAALRGVSVITLAEAQSAGLLAFAEVWGRAAWVVCDPGGRIAEGRRLDGLMWEAYGSMPARKCHAWGGQKNWPVNLEQAAQRPTLAMVEGGPDALAALEFVRREGVADTVGVVAMLGAANTLLDAEALPLFRGKQVRLFPHVDAAGRTAAREWARVLMEAGAARVDAFDLSGLECRDGRPGKDLCDLLNIAPECRGRSPKFQGRIMP